MIRQALLPEERAAVAAFLAASGLAAPVNAAETLYAEEDGRIVGTVSRAGELVSHLAVAPSHRGEAVASALLTETVSRMNAEGISRRLVFTKTDYVPLFESMHFKTVARSETVAILENGVPDLAHELDTIRRIAELHYGAPLSSLDVGATVVNCNPMTKGHLGLIAYAAAKHQAFLVFVLEEDASAFTYDERIAMVRLGCAGVENALVLPSTKYVVSNLTFPSYFLKTMDERDAAHARLDAVIFRDRFMPALHLKTRYIGTETDPMMQRYNAILKETLGDRIVEIVRYEQSGTPISASRVRRLIAEGKIDAALELVPESNRALLRALSEANHGER